MLLQKGETLGILIKPEEDEAVRIAVANLASDLNKVLGAGLNFGEGSGKHFLVGSIEHHRDLESGKIRDALKHKEGYFIRVVGDEILILGADRRGTIYGIYEFSRRFLGVSPWYFFADVPVRAKEQVEIPDLFEDSSYPTVEYRGVFINDEEELEAWVKGYFHEETIGVLAYEKIFELLLRLKLNYIWPAMHVNSFNVKRENGELAHRMGIVVGTSHCDMLMRSNNREWMPWLAKKGYEGIEYDYTIEGRNREILQEYWAESVDQNRDFEVSYTLGMRGIHDSGFETRGLKDLEGEALRNARIKLLEQVMADQEKILQEHLGRDTMKIFVPYKEVLELYDNGLKVPEDLTLIWTNDNYGYVRRYPGAKEKARKGGNGLYYHNSYWAPPGGSYLFICSIPLAQTANELMKAYDQGIRKLWVTNFGALKPLEQQISFYAYLSWNAGRPDEEIEDTMLFIRRWLNETFTGDIGNRLASDLARFDQVTNVRKLEQMDSDTFAQYGYGDEAAERMHFYEQLTEECLGVYHSLPEEERDAFFQLVLMRVLAAHYTNAMYYFADRSHIRAKLCDQAGATLFTECSLEYDRARRALLNYYNHVMAGGKWNGILTPEVFPPPRTSMHPACCPVADPPVPGVPKMPEPECRENRIFLEGFGGGVLTDDWQVIPWAGRYKGYLVQAREAGAGIDYSFRLPKSGAFLLEIHRYPSLNSVGQIRVAIAVDDGLERVLSTKSNDEHRGNWEQNNIRDGVERMYLELPNLAEGEHVLHVRAVDQYFAFSRMVIYTEERLPNQLGVPVSRFVELPKRFDKEAMGGDLFGEEAWALKPRPVIYCPDWEKLQVAWNADNTVPDSDITVYPESFGERLSADAIMDTGNHAFEESEGHVYVEAATAFRNSFHAYFENGDWDVCNSPSHGESGLGMCLRHPGKRFAEDKSAPCLRYRVNVTGGEYTIWARVWTRNEAQYRMAVGVDGGWFPPEELNGGKRIWRFCAENVWRWVPLVRTDISRGQHQITLYAFASGLRVEALYLTKGDELPPAIS